MHDAGCLVLPNVWNMTSAALVVAAGYPALATTSGGIAFCEGVPDGERIGRDRMLEVTGAIARRFSVPVSADLEAGYGRAPEDVAETVRQAIDAGLVGCNLEDSDPTTHQLFGLEFAVERICAGVQAARSAGLADFVINARVDTWIGRFGTAQENEHEAVRRANAYLAAGARSAFVPGPTDAHTIRRLVTGIRGPLNIVTNVGRHVTPSLDALRALGVRRASLGVALMLATYGAARRALEHLRERGTFDFADASISTREMARWLGIPNEGPAIAADALAPRDRVPKGVNQ